MRPAIKSIVNGMRYVLCSGVVIIGLMMIVGTSDKQKTAETLNTPPTAIISSPTDGTTFAKGAYITFGGTATDTEDGTVAPSSISWSSNIDGFLGSGSSLTSAAPLSAGVHTITMVATDSKGSSNSTSVAITISPDSNSIPTVTIATPSANDQFSTGDYITFSGSADDSEDGALTGQALEWRSSLDGLIGTGSSITTNILKSGTHLITLNARDMDGYTGTASVSIVVKNIYNTSPTATINYPADGATISAGTSVTFNGEGTDSEDGTLTGNQLEWRSNLDGLIGMGTSPTVNWLHMGVHTITLIATDSDGGTDSTNISLTVEDTAPTVTINSPTDAATYSTDAFITFSGSATDDEGGALSYAWTSSLDGDLGLNDYLVIKGLSPGLHIITLKVTDSGGLSALETVTITVQ